MLHDMEHTTQVVVLAGGKGTRLGDIGKNRPKALVEIAGKPILQHQLMQVRRYGFSRVLVLTGYLGDQIEDYLASQDFGLDVTCIREDRPRGTAGAVKSASSYLDNAFLVVYGDIIFDMDLHRLIQFDREHGALATIVAHPNDHPYDSDLVEVDERFRLRKVHRKDRASNDVRANLVNTGIYCMTKSTVDALPEQGVLDFGLDVLPALAQDGNSIFAYRTSEFIKDVGTLDRLKSVEHDILSGRVARRNLNTRQTAVFLDRDGVLNREIGDHYKADDLELLPDVAKAIRRIDQSDHLAIVVTNQPGIAKGRLSEGDLSLAHARLDWLLGQEGAFLHDVFYCPHHPERGHVGERAELKIPCTCRKPQPGLLHLAAERYNIDLHRSFMIGDRTVDIMAALNANCCAILVNTGFAGKDGKFPCKPDLAFDSLDGAVAAILTMSDWMGATDSIADLIGAHARTTGTAPIVVKISGAQHLINVATGLLTWRLRLKQIPVWRDDQKQENRITTRLVIIRTQDGTGSDMPESMALSVSSEGIVIDADATRGLMPPLH